MVTVAIEIYRVLLEFLLECTARNELWLREGKGDYCFFHLKSLFVSDGAAM
jgi:hypothetical protein